MNYESALEYIHAVQWAGHKPGLSRTRTLLAALGDPHKKLRFVHVAGTNGKGSTAAMLASCLQAAGYRVGLYTSPFINRFNERIQVNGEQIPDDALVRLVERVRPAADAMADVPTEFEIITALGMLWFAEEKCDIVVLEVGLGGTLDSTNVIDPPECAVITALGMDHVKELGPTIADIAAAKAGIIKPGSPVVSYGGVPEADAVIARVAKEQNAPLTVVDLSRLKVEGGDLDAVTFDFDGLDGVRLPLIGSYQPKNAALAITALRVLRGRGWNIPDSAIRTGLERVSWPGRFELLRHSPAFPVDGSHNAHGIAGHRPEPPGPLTRGRSSSSCSASWPTRTWTRCWHCCCRWQSGSSRSRPTRPAPCPLRRWQSTSASGAERLRQRRTSRRASPARWSWAATARCVRWGLSTSPAMSGRRLPG